MDKKKVYRDLEDYSNRQQQPGQFRPMTPKRGRFPVNLVILISVLAFVFYMWQSDDPSKAGQPSLVSKIFALAAKNRFLGKFVGAAAKVTGTEIQSAPSTDMARSPASVSPNDPNYVPTDDELRMGQFVQISGKYFRYNPEHIYMVNGIRTFYVSNRKHDVVDPKSAAPKTTN